MPPRDQANTVITEETRVSIGVILTVVSIFGLALLAGVFWVGVTVTKIDSRMAGIEEANQRAWTVDNQKLWAAQMKANNGTLNIPDVDSIRGRK